MHNNNIIPMAPDHPLYGTTHAGGDFLDVTRCATCPLALTTEEHDAGHTQCDGCRAEQEAADKLIVEAAPQLYIAGLHVLNMALQADNLDFVLVPKNAMARLSKAVDLAEGGAQ